MRGAAWRGAKQAATSLLGAALLGVPAVWALDCDGRWLTRTELAICTDPQLLRMEQQLARRIKGNAGRLNLGQYLGLRHWQADRASERNACQADRECIAASMRSQARFLDRLQRCVATTLARRACLYNLLLGERASLRR
jgi:uncharacterized protein